MPVTVNDKGYIQQEGIWLPPINLKQFEVFNDFHRYLLVHGPRKSGKTFALIHKALRHAFDVNGAMIAIVTKTLKNAKSAGVWTCLDRAMLPIWKQNCFGFRVVEGPKTTGDTKMSFVKIRNRHGTVSEIQCHSLEHAPEVEAKFKGASYSMIWASEADQYLNEHAFHIFCDTLRMWPTVNYAEHQIVLDMNPPDTGTNNFFHDIWFKYKDHPPKQEDDFDPIFYEGIHRIGFSIDDNPQLDEREKRELISRYKKRRTLYNRFILGLWEADITDGHFSDVWDEATHLIGNVEKAEDEWEVAVPTAGCTTLLGGWDMGESKNHSFHIIEKIVTEDPVTKRKLVSFSVIDELVVIRTYISIRQFVEAVMDKIEHWNAWHKKTNGIDLKWRHYSDTSAFRERSAAEASEASIAFEASNGQIVLEPAPKYRNSNRDKVKLVWELLHQKRLHVSAQLFRTRTMFTNLRSGTEAEYIKDDDHKHPFDSMSYPIMSEAPMDMLRSADIGSVQKKASPGLVIASL